MQLNIIKPLEYISPSSYLRMIECEYSEYLNRCSEYTLPRLPQTEPMAIGSAFDSFVKAEIARLLGKPNKLAQLLNTVESQNKHLIPVAHSLFDLYNYYGFVKALMDEGVEDIELDIRKTIGQEKVEGAEILIGGVPLFGKPDAMLRKYRPIDWKVNGWGSRTGQSPKQSYKKCLQLKGSSLEQHTNMGDKGSHKEYPLPMDCIDEKWATQLLIYYWLSSPIDSPLVPVEVGIDQVAIRGETVCFAVYRAGISKSFCQQTFDKLKSLWESFKTGQIPEPTPFLFKCEPFGLPKPCTMVCSYYKEQLTGMAGEMLKAAKSR